MATAGGPTYVSCLDNTIPSDFQHHLRLLSPYASTNMEDLSDDARHSVQMVVDKMKSVHDNFAARSEHISMITSVFADGATPVTGTLRGFMIGCYRNKEFGLPLGCTPSCLASVPSHQVGPDSIVNCEDGVLHYDGEKLSLMNNKLTPSMYMYMDAGATYPLVKGSADWKMLTDNGVKSVSVIRTGDTGYNRVGTYNLIDSGSWGWFWFWFLIIAVIVIVLVAYSARKSKMI